VCVIMNRSPVLFFCPSLTSSSSPPSLSRLSSPLSPSPSLALFLLLLLLWLRRQAGGPLTWGFGFPRIVSKMASGRLDGSCPTWIGGVGCMPVLPASRSRRCSEKPAIEPLDLKHRLPSSCTPLHSLQSLASGPPSTTVVPRRQGEGGGGGGGWVGVGWGGGGGGCGVGGGGGGGGVGGVGGG